MPHCFQLYFFIFQSTLPNGSDCKAQREALPILYFNPRSQTGATRSCLIFQCIINHFNPRSQTGATQAIDGSFCPRLFQSTLPNGSDMNWNYTTDMIEISIHAPKRERQGWTGRADGTIQFQSTLPNGSDIPTYSNHRNMYYFNPRSQTGATETAI